MPISTDVLLLILACAAVTVSVRVLPFLLVNQMQWPDWFLNWLEYIPVAVVSALFFSEIFLEQGAFRSLQDPYLLAGLITLLGAFLVRNIIGIIIMGVLVFSLLNHLLS